MSKRMIVVATVVAVLGLAGCGASTDGGADSNALPQDTTTSASSGDAATEEPPAKASTCDKAREAILTGTKKDIDAAMKALVKDKKADATAREAAQDYLNEKDAELKKMQVDLVQMACSI